MRVVVFGATGNIGTSVLERLGSREVVREIVGVARRIPSRPYPRTRFVSADVGRDDLAPLLRDADAVVHLAWRIQPGRRPTSIERTNVVGSGRVFEAVARAGVGALVYASSVGAYSPARAGRPVGEDHATRGVASSRYSRQKAEVEGILDRVEEEVPELRVVRIRPALTFKREAAWGIRRLFLGPFVPRLVFSGRLVPAVPEHPTLRTQAVHSLDVGEAFARAVVRDVRGAFNIAAEPVLRAEDLAGALDAGLRRMDPENLRKTLSALYRLRLAPVEPGWFDLLRFSPLMRTERARSVLGWRPQRSATFALTELLDGLARGACLDTPPLRPQRKRGLEDALGMPERARGGVGR